MTTKQPTQTEIAHALGVAKSRVTAMKAQGMPTHTLEAAQAWRQAHLSPARAKPTAADHVDKDHGGTETFSEARGRREIAEADKAEFELSQLQGVLINREGIEMALETAFRQIRDTIMSVPDRLPIDAAHRTMFRNALRDTLTDALKMLPVFDERQAYAS